MHALLLATALAADPADLPTAAAPPKAVFPLEEPPPPPAEDRAALTADRVTTYVRPKHSAVWMTLGAGGSLRVAPDSRLAPQVDLFAAAPLLFWQGAFEPGIVPHVRVAWTGADRIVAGAGVGVARLD